MAIPQATLTGAEIKRLRTECGLDVEEFARRLGSRAEYLTAVEEDKMQPSDTFLEKIRIFTERSRSGMAVVTAHELSQLAENPGQCAVRRPTGEVQYYADVASLRNAVLGGQVSRSWDARRLSPGKQDAEAMWLTLERLSESEFRLRSLYRPVWAHTMKGAMIGFVVVALLKGLDTTIGLFFVSQAAGFAWLLVLAALVSPKFKLQAFVLAMLVMAQARLPNLWFGPFGLAVVAAAFGCPAGAALGTVTGYVRSRGLPKAADARPEGINPVLLGLVLPVVFLVAAVPFYLFWLNPRMLAWVSR